MSTLIRLRLTIVAAGLIAGCGQLPQSHTRAMVDAGALRTIDGKTPFLKAHLRSGEVAVLSAWHEDTIGRYVTGQGDRLDMNRRLLRTGEQRIALDSVALFETNSIGTHGSVAALAIVTGASVAMTAYCLANPKACFGSCPTFYVMDSSGAHLVAEGFSSSVSPALEATDVDAIGPMRATSRTFTMTMRNEALETHNVRWADLLAVPRADGERVFADRTGAFWRSSAIEEPGTCTAAEGDCLATVLARDGVERFSAADSTDLAQREIVEVVFLAQPRRGARLALIVGSRQTLLSTFLFYQQLSYMGREAVPMLAALQRGGPAARSQALGIARAMGLIEVLVADSVGRWQTIGEAGESGPLASDVQAVLLPGTGDGPVHLKLRLARGHWRLDYLALVQIAGAVLPVRVRPSRVLRQGKEDPVALAALLDDARYLTTLPGEDYTLEYRLPEDFARHEFFLESRGYYLEWMRAEWLAEEDAGRAMMMITEPSRALRELAPAFKRLEPRMEAAFWRSRYVRH